MRLEGGTAEVSSESRVPGTTVRKRPVDQVFHRAPSHVTACHYGVTDEITAGKHDLAEVSSTRLGSAMQESGRSALRAAILAALVVLLVVALRSPFGDQGAAREERPPSGDEASLLGVVALLALSLLIVALALVASLRGPRRSKPSGGYELPGIGRLRVRPSWRLVVIVISAVLTWLVMVALLAQVRLGQTDPGSRQSTPLPDRPGVDPRPSPPPTVPAVGGEEVWRYLTAGSVALILLIVAGAILLRVRNRAPAPAALKDAAGADVPAAPESGSLAVAAELGLAVVGDLNREPREAIIACYAAMERALADAPEAAPQDSDTASEVLERAVGRGVIHAEGGTELVKLFAEARFSTHVMIEAHREAAERALRLVLTELRSPV